MSIMESIDHVFSSLDHNMDNPNYVASRAMLSMKKNNVDGINMCIIERFLGKERRGYTVALIVQE